MPRRRTSSIDIASDEVKPQCPPRSPPSHLDPHVIGVGRVCRSRRDVFYTKVIGAPNSPKSPRKRQDHADEDAAAGLNGKGWIVHDDPHALRAECAGASSSSGGSTAS